MKFRASDILGVVLCSVLLGAASYYLVAPYADGLGLVVADPFSLLICLPVAIAYGITFGRFQKHNRVSRGMASALFFLMGAVAMVVIYPAPSRYHYPSSSLKASVGNYVQRCVQGYDVRDKVTILRREKLFFDLLKEHQWDVSIWPFDRSGSFSFYIMEKDIEGDCQKQLVLRNYRNRHSQAE